MSDVTMEIVTLVERLIVVLVVAVLAPAVKKWLNAKQIDRAVEKGVNTAQQLYWSESGAQRKSIAIGIAKGLLEKAGIKISEAQLDALIEAAVQELHIARGDYKVEDKA